MLSNQTQLVKTPELFEQLVEELVKYYLAP